MSIENTEDIKQSADSNEHYLNSLILKAKAHWKDINPDEWLDNLRDSYEA